MIIFSRVSGVESINEELEKLVNAQHLILRSQEELLDSLRKEFKKGEIPEILMEGYSKCPNCRGDFLTHTHDKYIWCSNCGHRARWHYRSPVCPNCSRFTLAFSPSGKAKCNSCNFEYYYKRDIEKPHERAREDPFRSVNELIQQSKRIILAMEEPEFMEKYGGKDAVSYWADDEEKARIRAEKEARDPEEKVLVFSRKEGKEDVKTKKWDVKERVEKTPVEEEQEETMEVEPWEIPVMEIEPDVKEEYIDAVEVSELPELKELTEIIYEDGDGQKDDGGEDEGEEYYEDEDEVIKKCRYCGEQILSGDEHCIRCGTLFGRDKEFKEQRERRKSGGIIKKRVPRPPRFRRKTLEMDRVDPVITPAPIHPMETGYYRSPKVPKESLSFSQKGGFKKIEKKIGSIWLLITGIIIVTIGLVFAGMWSWSKVGNLGKIIGIFLFGIAVAVAGEYLFRNKRMIPFSNGLTILAFLSAYSACAVIYHYDYPFQLFLAISVIIIIFNIAASYRYQMYMLIGMSIITAYLLATIMRITEIDGEPFISAPHYAMLLVGIASLFSIASYLVFDRTRSSKMAYITVIVSNLWLIVFNEQMTMDILMVGALVMLLTAFLATGTSKMGLKRSVRPEKEESKRTSKTIKRIPRETWLLGEKERKKLLYFQFLWYGSLFLSMLVCIIISRKDVEPMVLGSYGLPWAALLFGATLLTYAGSAIYLKKEVTHPWIFGIMTFGAALAMGLQLETFLPLAVSFILANVLLLVWRRNQYLWYGSLAFSMILCIFVSQEDITIMTEITYKPTWAALLFGTTLLTYAGLTIHLRKVVTHPWFYSVITFGAALLIGYFLETFLAVALSYILANTFLLCRRHHRSLWYSGLVFSMALCVLSSWRDMETIALNSFDLHWAALLLGAALLTYTGLIIQLKKVITHPWTYSIITFPAAVCAGVFLETFWPVAIIYIIANALLLTWRRHRYLWYGSLVFSMALCVLVSWEDSRSITLGAYDLPRASLLFGATLLIHTGLTLHLKGVSIRPWAYSLITFAAGLLIGFFLETYLPVAVFYMTVHAIMLIRTHYDHYDICYPLMAILIMLSYVFRSDALLLEGLLGWGLLYLMVPLYLLKAAKKGSPGQRVEITFTASMILATLIMAVITPGISIHASQVSLFSLLLCVLVFNHEISKGTTALINIFNPEGSELKQAKRNLQNTALLLGTSVLAFFIPFYSFKGYLTSWENFPLVDLVLVFVCLFTYQAIKRRPTFTVIIPATAALIALYVYYMENPVGNNLLVITLLCVVGWIYVLAHGFLRKPVSSFVETFQAEFTASWLALPVFLFIILNIDPFDHISSYVYWALVLSVGISAVVIRNHVLHRSLGLLVLAFLLLLAGYMSSFGNGAMIVKIYGRGYFLPGVLSVISITYIISKPLIGSTERKHTGNEKTPPLGGDRQRMEQQEDNTRVLWLFFALLVSCFACRYGGIENVGKDELGHYMIFIFFSINWLLLLYSSYRRKSQNWHILLPLVALWPLGLGIYNRGTMAVYLLLSFTFVLAAHIFFNRRAATMSKRRKVLSRKHSPIAWGQGLASPLKATMYASTISLVAVGLGVLTEMGAFLEDIHLGCKPNTDFYIHYGLGMLHFLTAFVFMTLAFNKGKKNRFWGMYKGGKGMNYHLIGDKIIGFNLIMAAFSGLFFILCLSLISLPFFHYSLAASGMVLISVFFMFYMYRERKRFWDFLVWGITAALMIRLLTRADPVEVEFITATTTLSGIASDLVLSAICLALVYLIWTGGTVKIFSKLNRISPELMACLVLIVLITPEGKFARYLVPLSILITAFKRKDAWSYPLAMLIFLLTFYMFTGNPSNPEEAAELLTTLQRRALLIAVMGIMLLIVLGTHKKFGREPMTGETSIALSAGIFVLAIVTFWSRSDFNWLISVIWAALGLSLVFFGHTLEKPYLRWMALASIGFVILKIILKDSSGLAMGYRVIVFLSVGIIVIIVSFLYYKLVEKEKKDKENSLPADTKR